MAGWRGGEDRDETLEAGQPYYRSGDGGTSRGRGGWLLPLMAGIVAVLCAGGLWFAYNALRGGAGGGEPPLIRADQTATKVRPDQPGGEEAPNQDKDVYNMGEGSPKAERLLPPPEQPLPKPIPVEAPPAPPPPAATATAAVVPSPAPTAQLPPQPSQNAPSPSAPPPPRQIAAAPVVPPPKPAPAPVHAAEPPAHAAEPPAVLLPPGTAPRPTPASAPAAGGGFRLQIAATKDQDKADAEWRRLQSTHPDLLGSLSMTVVKADLGDKGVFYRLQAGPIADKGEADKLCDKLKAVSIGCIVVRTP